MEKTVITVRELGLPVFVRTKLYGMGFETVEDLVKCSRWDLIEGNVLNEDDCRKLEEALAGKGLALSAEPTGRVDEMDDPTFPLTERQKMLCKERGCFVEMFPPLVSTVLKQRGIFTPEDVLRLGLDKFRAMPGVTDLMVELVKDGAEMNEYLAARESEAVDDDPDDGEAF